MWTGFASVLLKDKSCDIPSLSFQNEETEGHLAWKKITIHMGPDQGKARKFKKKMKRYILLVLDLRQKKREIGDHASYSAFRH